MGVYHLMGLGTSPGAITAPISYLAHRFHRWEPGDRAFFERSGEAKQRKENQKVGDIQALVLFTTPEVLDGTRLTSPYIVNQAATTKGEKFEKMPMKSTLSGLLSQILSPITHRKTVDLFWCSIDRRDIHNVYGRIIRVVAALSGVGGQGKEMWANLTGGNNVTNFALELAATLSGQVARLYYIQAQNEDAEKCVRFTTEQGYWMDLPVMPLAIGRLRDVILQIVQDKAQPAEKIYGLIKNDYWDLAHGLESAELLTELYLKPMRKQGLLLQTDDGFQIGAQWELIRPFESIWKNIKDDSPSIENLAKNENWIEHQELILEK